MLPKPRARTAAEMMSELKLQAGGERHARQGDELRVRRAA